MNYQNQSRSAMPELAKAWAALQAHALLGPIRTDADFERVHALANDLSDEVGDDESHPLFSLFELAMELIEKWEDEHVVIPDTEPKEVLRFLLEENNLKQKDLADIASPTLISDILAGRREISRVLAKSLSTRFNVNASVFI
ncbi:helix-turn-helix domain-containing protein [Agrobacterium tumefaciens]|jgi:HTH-type transcriptional regulator / antitoxin HigA|uniref:helix-turn-helix domain-containing protein n=1 Tax=Agrobacterium tumefaciens TaxID=358 RepID=UPI001BAC03E2|nr:helix-turn-helix domain-containing protein [Agrobacterium tumefaciens]